MQQLHKQTDITLKNSFEQTQFIDWRTQARSYKLYPNFFRRYNIDEYEELRFIKNFGKITTTKKYGKEEVNLRANPSAGGLYPCEVYIQIRGIKGFLSGIYHYEPLNNNLTLIHELSNDGLEYYFNTDSKKFIFLISNVYFRSSWKYDKRANRYLLLDTGHQLASIYTSLKNENISFDFEFNFDKKNLNKEFGFDTQEFFQCAILVDNEKDTKPKQLRETLVSVAPTDYFIKNIFLEEFIKRIEDEKIEEKIDSRIFENLEIKNIQNSIDKRRSIRGFKKESISKNEFEELTKDIFEIAQKINIELYFINNNIKDMKQGVYKNVTLVEEGDFKPTAAKLAFNQKLGGDSCFTLFFTANENSNYLVSYIFSAFLAHIINLRCTNLDIGCSGIGAYFDDESKKVLNTTNNILYLQAIGK
ncbi:nitroreductase family protein [Halarcobacter sp.]|uniref:nitroreductase family protein n=1 Tax=Halarcobacter sp. TaxID=2321133 RepID=UPI0029F48183|nr:nitroreductase family protein [Halarcobacter sp.]